MRITDKFKADVVLALCMVIWGATFVVVQDALAYASVMVFLAARFLLAAAILAVVYFGVLRKMGRGALWAGGLMGVFLFGGYICQTVGLKFTTPSKAAFLNGSSTIWVPLMMSAAGMRKIGGWVWAGVVTAMVGLYLLAIPASGFSHLNLGDALSVGSAIMFAFHILVVARYSQRFPVSALSFVQIGLTGVLALCAVPLVSAAGLEAPRFAWNGYLAFALALTAIGCTVLAFSGQVWAQRHTTPTHAAILFTLEPVFAAITSYIVLHERLAPRALSGAVLILGAILLAELKGPVQAPPDSEGGEGGTAGARA